ncbi:hypothetical protein COY07_00510 [Candidatus Peregrinibacteria bacterium CG_4_10_14_0_2_um_filter_43_11]|nr:MAG: hypothetical protein COY07_00510 [Candidatus Peregrinibacteria bacterium CG_4_10_14_0_2_um_filter_43_11]
MKREQAQTIVRDTLQNDFEKGRFIYFIKNLLNTIDESPFVYRGNLIPDAYEKYISSFERIGKYNDGENKIDILIVRLKKEASIERARTMQRNFIAWYLNGSRGGELKDAALVAFVSPEPANWRFSLVKMEYKFEKGEKGRMKVKEEFTPAKRWSFLVGTYENSHTAQSRLSPIVEDDKNNPTLNELEDAFNIEKVTKEFFEKYRELFLRVNDTLNEIATKDSSIKKDFEEKGVNIVDFSKKLLGQIVFLYFLQKKGWFGVPMDKGWGEGDKKFLRSLYEKAISDNKNYFNDYLEPLFYEALAKERDDDYYSRFECKIPFLNGGLFVPINNYDWVNTVINIPFDLFSNKRKTKEGDVGDGILDIFDRYNFTVKEDEPLEKEVAVDPEMLGKVFENLLEVKDRKSKGTYYTPREIVHYMCEQSLANYLATELYGNVSKEDLEKLIKQGESVGENEARVANKGHETDTYHYKLPESIRKNAKAIDIALANIKVCDPAIGSGAFPVGMMHEIVKARLSLNPYICEGQIMCSGRSPYDFKFECIQNSLYGVDIDPGAVEIAKLRLWLSLVVDEDDIKQIKPLPNLDYKIMQGNSLLEEFEGIKLFDEKLIASIDLSAEKQIEELKQKQALLQKEYFELHSANRLTPAKQAELNTALKSIQSQLKKINQQGKTVAENSGLFDVYSEAKQKGDELKRLHQEFFATTQKSKKDAIKAKIERLEWDLIEATLKEQNNETSQKKLEQFKKSNAKPFFLWKLHFADVFEEKGGFDVMIANPPYIDSESMVKNGQADVREAIQKNYSWTKGNWDIYIAFFELGFRELNQCGTLTFITPDKWISKPFGNELRKGIIDNILTILKAGRKIFENAKVDSIISIFSKVGSSDIKIVNFEDNNFILKRIIDKKSLTPPFAFDHLFSDSLDLLLKISNLDNKLSEFCKCENACATSDAYKLAPLIKDLGKVSFEKNKYLKIINTGTIGKYYAKWGKREMTYLKHKYLYPIVEKDEFLNLFKNSYGNKSLLPKIIIKGLNLLDGCLDDSGTIIPGKTTLVITDTDIKKLKCFLAIINSKLALFYIEEKYPAASYNQGTSFTKDMLNNLPIPSINELEKNTLIELSEKIPILAMDDGYEKNKEKQAKVREYEKQIDRLVYKLYRLTPEEIAIVENSSK